MKLIGASRATSLRIWTKVQSSSRTSCGSSTRRAARTTEALDACREPDPRACDPRPHPRTRVHQQQQNCRVSRISRFLRIRTRGLIAAHSTARRNNAGVGVGMAAAGRPISFDLQWDVGSSRLVENSSTAFQDRTECDLDRRHRDRESTRGPAANTTRSILRQRLFPAFLAAVSSAENWSGSPTEDYSYFRFRSLEGDQRKDHA